MKKLPIIAVVAILVFVGALAFGSFYMRVENPLPLPTPTPIVRVSPWQEPPIRNGMLLSEFSEACPHMLGDDYHSYSAQGDALWMEYTLKDHPDRSSSCVGKFVFRDARLYSITR